MRHLSVAILFLLLVVGPAHAGGLLFYVGEIFPFTRVAESGEVSGAAVDIVSELMASVGRPVRTRDIRCISFARSVEIMETTPGTGMFLFARTPQREAKFKWVGPIAELKLGLVARKSAGIDIKCKDDLKRYAVSVIRNSAPMQMLENDPELRDVKLEVVKDDVLQLRMLEAGRVDLAAQADTAAAYWLQAIGVNPDDFEMVYVLKDLPLYLAFNKSVDDELVARLQVASEAMRKKDWRGRSRYETIMRKYLDGGMVEIKR